MSTTTAHPAVLPSDSEVSNELPIDRVELKRDGKIVGTVTRSLAGEHIAESGGKIAMYRSIESAIHWTLQMARGGV